MWAFLTVMFVVGCRRPEPDPAETDLDFDGVTADLDCDDLDPEIRPGVSEICDGLDNDCDDFVDEDAVGATLYHLDEDGDGYGDTADTKTACEEPKGYVENGDDCDDADEEIHPGADERCNELDDDCDGSDDEEAGDLWYDDVDQDGFGNPATGTRRCEGNPGVTRDDTDCSDHVRTVNPGAAEVCDGMDNDCDRQVDDDDPTLTSATTWYKDKDDDGYGKTTETKTGCLKPRGYELKDNDCEDQNPDVNPGIPEVCGDGIDNDCKNGVDDGGATDARTWYLDGDGDGFGAGIGQTGCEAPSDQHVDNDKDCNDGNPDLNPARWWYRDADGDTYGSETDGLKSCLQPTSYVSDNSDCNDNTNTSYPGASELCDAKDNDCDDVVDNGLPVVPWYRDEDHDGYGNPDEVLDACTKPDGYINLSTDCDDTDATLNPSTVWYVDADGDGLGALGLAFATQCESPGAGYAPNDDDCSDSDADVGEAHPWYRDADGDGYGDPFLATFASCTGTFGYVDNPDDCDDKDATATPETIWYLDGDGDGWGGLPSDPSCERPSAIYVEEGGDCDDFDPFVTPFMTWYFDADGDGYGDEDTPLDTDGCEVPEEGYVANDLDCDDDDILIHPDTVWYRDDDDDGYGDPDSPYDDPQCANPGPIYVPNGYDCDDDDDDVGAGPEWFYDLDGDGYGDPEAGWPGPVLVAPSCASPDPDTVDNDLDCDDTDADLNPDTVWYKDADGDGFGDPDKDFGSTQCADPGSKWVRTADDCDDSDADLGTESAWYLDDDVDGYGDPDEPWPVPECLPPTSDYVDNDDDCDDADPDVSPDTVWYADTDDDGFGDAANPYDDGAPQCESPGDGYVLDTSDCDDTDENVGNGIVHTFDSDGDGFGDDSAPWPEATCTSPDDGYVEEGGDCDDLDPDINPDTPWYHDSDGDGFGNINDPWTGTSCTQPDAAYVLDKTDCNDGNNAIGGLRSWFDDTDADGYGDPAVFWPMPSCVEPDPAYVDNDDDCDPTSGEVHPDTVWYPDADSDGYGDTDLPHADVQCEMPEDGYVPRSGDCDDLSDDINPDTVWYVDDDEDGYGLLDADPHEDSPSCEAPDDGGTYAISNDDCDDDDDAQHPGAVEVCNGEDDDCDDDGDPADAWWDAGWGYRIPVEVTAGTVDGEALPVAVEVDFGAALAALGADPDFDPDEVRVATNDCLGALGTVEIPSQFVDGLGTLFGSGSSVSAEDDAAGTVVFLYDEDGDLDTTEALAAGTSASFAIYFGNPDASAPSYDVPTGVSADTGSLVHEVDDGEVTLSFAGGVLTDLGVYGTSDVAAQGAAGNGVRIDGEWVGPGGSFTGDLSVVEEVVADGPLFAAVRFNGDAALDSGDEVSYEWTWAVFARGGDPGVYVRVRTVAETELLLEDGDDWTDAIRPLHLSTDGLDGAIVSTDFATFVDVSLESGGAGYTWAWAVAPEFDLGFTATDTALRVVGNDVADATGESETTVDAGTPLVDGATHLILAHTGDHDEARETLVTLLSEGADTDSSAAEAASD